MVLSCVTIQEFSFSGTRAASSSMDSTLALPKVPVGTREKSQEFATVLSVGFIGTHDLT